jgi:voltage-gated potassium channel
MTAPPDAHSAREVRHVTTASPPHPETAVPRPPGRADLGQPRRNAYQILILVLTVLSLGIMVGLLLPLSAPVHDLLRVYDNLICVVFLIDFAVTLYQAPRKRTYFVRERGWLDLIGSLPALGFFQITALLRVARLSRVARIGRLLRGQQKRELIADVLANRGQYAALVTVTITILILIIASILELQFEGQAPNANIVTGEDALWWSAVTITTVGYGDKYPVTIGGQITAVFVMFSGIGVIGALASILSSLILPAPPTDTASTPAPDVTRELDALRAEVAALRQLLVGTQATVSAEPVADGAQPPEPEA